jgi:dethiobiotin synthetase
MRAVFVTGTGTGIGKTFVTAGLVRILRSRGLTVSALKPVASGFDLANAGSSDPGLLLDALGRDLTEATLDEISPWRFAAPLSPDMAARREGHSIDFGGLVAFCRQAAQADGDALLIEGVGGVMVPLNDEHTVLDWMAALQLPLLLVAGSYLGTISHTLSALDVIQRRALDIAAIVVSETPGSTVDLAETAETIARFSGEVKIIPLRRPAGSYGIPELECLVTRLWS